MSSIRRGTASTPIAKSTPIHMPKALVDGFPGLALANVSMSEGQALQSRTTSGQLLLMPQPAADRGVVYTDAVNNLFQLVTVFAIGYGDRVTGRLLSQDLLKRGGIDEPLLAYACVVWSCNTPPISARNSCGSRSPCALAMSLGPRITVLIPLAVISHGCWRSLAVGSPTEISHPGFRWAGVAIRCSISFDRLTNRTSTPLYRRAYS